MKNKFIQLLIGLVWLSTTYVFANQNSDAENYLRNYIETLQNANKQYAEYNILLVKALREIKLFKDRNWLSKTGEIFDSIIAEYQELLAKPVPENISNLGAIIRNICKDKIKYYELEKELSNGISEKKNHDRIKPQLVRIDNDIRSLSTKVNNKTIKTLGEYQALTLLQQKNTKQNEIIRQDLIAVKMLQKYIAVYNSKKTQKLKNLLIIYQMMTPAQRQAIKNDLREKSEFKLTAVSVNYYNNYSISGTFVYRCKVEDPKQIGSQVAVVTNNFYLIKRNGKWMIYKLFPIKNEKGLGYYDVAFSLEAKSKKKYNVENLNEYK